MLHTGIATPDRAEYRAGIWAVEKYCKEK